MKSFFSHSTVILKKLLHMVFEVSLILLFISSTGDAQELHLSAPLTQYNDYNRMPDDVLCFPSFSQDYRRKIESPIGHYEIWNEKAITRWAHAQGFSVSQDHADGGYQYKYGMIFYAPGLTFHLSVPKSSLSLYGWKLILDMGFLQQSSRTQRLSNDFHNYENILRYNIYIDGIKYKTIEIGYGVSLNSPLEIPIPYIRNKSGKVTVRIELANHPNNFAILYDAFLARE